MGYIVAFVFGVVVGAVGLDGTLNMFSKGVEQVRTVSKDAAK